MRQSTSTWASLGHHEQLHAELSCEFDHDLKWFKYNANPPNAYVNELKASPYYDELSVQVFNYH